MLDIWCWALSHVRCNGRDVTFCVNFRKQSREHPDGNAAAVRAGPAVPFAPGYVYCVNIDQALRYYCAFHKHDLA